MGNPAPLGMGNLGRREMLITNEEKIKRFDKVYSLVQEQAEDEGLWFKSEYATEDYLQTALRKLHAVVEADKIEGFLS